MSTPAFEDSYGNKYYNQRVGCVNPNCSNGGVEINITAPLGGIIQCGVCGASLTALAQGEHVLPEPEEEVVPPEDTEPEPTLLPVFQEEPDPVSPIE